MPKIELHAHLNASLTRKSFVRLLEHKGLSSDVTYLDNKSNDSIFNETFIKLKQSVTCREDLEFICREVFQGFFEDGVVYLEIRSTPKPLEDISPVEYIDTVIKIIQEFEDKIVVRYLFSLNRSVEPALFDPVLRTYPLKPLW